MVTDEQDSQTDALSRSERLELLASKRRRTLLELLATSAEDVHSLESLTAAVAQSEQSGDLDASPPHQVRLSLHHVHLPKLDDADIIEYDPQRNVVEYTSAGELEQLLDAVGD